jgi:hypothetical protein
MYMPLLCYVWILLFHEITPSRIHNTRHKYNVILTQQDTASSRFRHGITKQILVSQVTKPREAQKISSMFF